MKKTDSSASTKVNEDHRKYRSVQWRIMQWQLPLLLVLLVVLLFWLEKHLENAFSSANLESVQRLSQMVVSQVQASMESKEPGRLWDRVEQLLPEDKATSLRIIDKRGVEIFSSDPETLGRKYDLSDPACFPCHVDGSADADVRSKFIDHPSGDPYTVFVAPLRNDEDCSSCHIGEGEILGMVYVSHSLEPVQRLVRTIQISLIIAGGLAIFSIMLTTRFFLGRYLNRPLAELVAGARAIGEGDLNHVIALPHSTELSELADTFNKSAVQLKETIQEIRTHRDDLQNLYYIADQLGLGVQPEDRLRLAVGLIGSIFQSDCLIIAGHLHPESKVFHGAVTFREGDDIVERRFSGLEDLPNVTFSSPSLVDRWLKGELDDKFSVREGTSVAFPLKRGGQRLGIILAPARKKEDSQDGRDTAANPEVVRAFIKHLSTALELSELQRERVMHERLAAIGEALAGVTHSLRNTLNGLRGGEYIIETAMRNDDEEKLKQGWGVLKGGIQRINKFTMNMLYYTSELKLKLEPITLNQIISKVIAMLDERANSKGVKLSSELDECMENSLLDRAAMTQAFLNLVTNAVDACFESETGDLVTIASHDRGEDLLITVEDNGIGMEEETARRVFDRFYTTKSSKGTGLGLPVTKKIIEAHGGRIEVKSTLGAGTTFFIQLPKDPSAPTDA